MLKKKTFRATKEDFYMIIIHISKRRTEGVTRSATASGHPLSMFTTTYRRGSWVLELSRYAPSCPSSLLPAACTWEVPYAGMS